MSTTAETVGPSAATEKSASACPVRIDEHRTGVSSLRSVYRFWTYSATHHSRISLAIASAVDRLRVTDPRPQR